MFTGAYAVVGGLALLAAPKATFGELYGPATPPSPHPPSGEPHSLLAAVRPPPRAHRSTQTLSQPAADADADALPVWDLAGPRPAAGLLFDALAVPSGWIRVGGALFALIGLQYLGTGLMHGQQGGAPMAFYRSTVWSRLFLVAAFVALVGTWQVQPSLLVLAALNLAGAVSMALAIRRDLSTTGAP